jgi:hypothetical protein
MEKVKVSVKSAHSGLGLAARRFPDHRNPSKMLNKPELFLYNPGREGVTVLRKPVDQVTYDDLSTSFVVQNAFMSNASLNDGDVRAKFRALNTVGDVFFPPARQMFARLLNMPKRDHGIISQIDRDMGLVVNPPKLQGPKNKQKPKAPPRPR